MSGTPGPVQSAGLLMYRFRNGEIELFLVHPGGPFYSRRDEGCWSIPKGIIEPPEPPLEAALREFEEETGLRVEARDFIPLGRVRMSSGKIIHAWAFEGAWDPGRDLVSNHFEMEWPPGSGHRASFPEIDRAEFFSLVAARAKIAEGQRPFLDRLREALQARGKPDGEEAG